MNYHNITYPDMNNGDGLRVVLWLSGCSHHCYNCQNPQTWDANSGILFDESAREELFRELDKDYISGLTLTGGDPLFEENLDDVLDLVTEINKRYNTPQDIVCDKEYNHNILNQNTDEIRLLLPEKTIWLYSGYTFEECLLNTKRREILKNTDVMVDGRYIDSQRDITLKWRGSSNQRVIDIKQSIKQNELVLYCN